MFLTEVKFCASKSSWCNDQCLAGHVGALEEEEGKKWQRKLLTNWHFSNNWFWWPWPNLMVILDSGFGDLGLSLRSHLPAMLPHHQELSKYIQSKELLWKCVVTSVRTSETLGSYSILHLLITSSKVLNMRSFMSSTFLNCCTWVCVCFPHWMWVSGVFPAFQAERQSVAIK